MYKKKGSNTSSQSETPTYPSTSNDKHQNQPTDKNQSGDHQQRPVISAEDFYYTNEVSILDTGSSVHTVPNSSFLVSSSITPALAEVELIAANDSHIVQFLLKVIEYY
jgi:hypothetical protein